MLRWVTLTGLLEVGCLEDRNMSFMPADLAAAEREAGWGIGRDAAATGLAEPEGSGPAADAGAAEAAEVGFVCTFAAAGRDVCRKRCNAPSLHK